MIATKGGFQRPAPGRWVEDGRPSHLREAVEGSLRRLRLERIDLYQLHRIDPKVPAVDQFGTLEELRRQRKIRHVGLSEVTVAQIEAARKVLPIASVQNRYSIADREWEDVLEYCSREALGFIWTTARRYLRYSCFDLGLNDATSRRVECQCDSVTCYLTRR